MVTDSSRHANAGEGRRGGRPRPCSGLVSALARRYHRSYGRTSSRRTLRARRYRTCRPIADVFSLAAACATTLWLPRSAWSQPRFASDPFALGSRAARRRTIRWCSGRGSRPEGIFRIEPSSDPITVRWEIAHDDKFDRIVQRGQSVARRRARGFGPRRGRGPRTGSLVFLPVHGGRCAAAPSAARGRFRRPMPRRPACASPTRRASAGSTATSAPIRHMRQENPDVVLFLGDYIYEYPNAKNAVRVPTGGWVRSLDDYRSALRAPQVGP